MIELKVPTLGESVTEATVGTWFKKVGDQIAVDEMICELETDKVTIEVPSSVSGVVSKIIAKEGETVELDGILALLEEGGAAAEKNKMPDVKVAEKNISEKPKNYKTAPSAEKIMKEKNIDPNSLKGTGREGRIMKEDVMSLPSNRAVQTGDVDHQG